MRAVFVVWRFLSDSTGHTTGSALMDIPKVVVVGAGLAGLACAHELEARGVGCTLLERDQRVGGRVQTEVVQRRP
jgi:monoamine oxidase